MGRLTNRELIGKGVGGVLARANFIKETQIGSAPLAPVRLTFDFFFPVVD